MECRDRSCPGLSRGEVWKINLDLADEDRWSWWVQGKRAGIRFSPGNAGESLGRWKCWRNLDGRSVGNF